MDKVLQNAMERRDAARELIGQQKNKIRDLQAVVARYEMELAEVDAWIAGWYAYSGIQPPPGEEQSKPVEEDARKRPVNPPRELVAEEALRIIRENAAPMQRKPLFDALTARGIVIRGKDPEMVLSTMLWRERDKIVRLPQWGYWPANVTHEDALYFPGLEGLMATAAQEPEDGIEADDAE